MRGGLSITYSDMEELGEILTTLCDLGLPFLDAAVGWPPAECFRALRQQGLVSGPAVGVAWRAPEQSHTFEI